MASDLVRTEKTAKSLKKLAEQVTMLTDLVNVLNNSVIALAYASNIKGNELDKLTADEYVEFVHKNVHPLTRKATELVTEIAKKTKEEIEKKAAEEAEKEKK